MNSASYQLKVRASSVSDLLTSPRAKSETLSETCKSMVEEKAIQDLFGVRKEISSKYLDKGVLMEPEAIVFLSRNTFAQYQKYDGPMLDDGVFTGTPDILYHDGAMLTIRDIKCSWERFTFPWTVNAAIKEIKKGGYEYQVRTYMMLSGAGQAFVDFVLLSTPEWLIREEEYDLHDVEDIPEPKRITSVRFERDLDWEKAARSAWVPANEYYQKYVSELLSKI